MVHPHSIYDTDLHFVIDPITRQISSESGKVVLMQNDHNSERFTFELPRFIEGHDMSLSNEVQIHYINVDGSNKATKNTDIYTADDLQISPDGEETVIFSWLLSRNATTFAGSLSFVVRFVCYADTDIEYQWFTDVFDKIKINKGIYNTDVIADEYDIDIVENWKRDILASFVNSEEYQTALQCADSARTDADIALTAAQIAEGARKVAVESRDTAVAASESAREDAEIAAEAREVVVSESEATAENAAFAEQHAAIASQLYGESLETLRAAQSTLAEANRKVTNTEFRMNFETGNLEYFSPSYDFKLNPLTGNLEYKPKQ